MALSSVGLKTHIWNNNAKCVLLLLTFPVLLVAVAYAGLLVYQALSADSELSLAQSAARAGAQIPWAAAVVFGGTAVWFLIAWLGHDRMIHRATHAQVMTRAEARTLYDQLETLCVSRGLTMPALAVIPTSALNAFASGLGPDDAAITVTQGLLDGLEPDEVEAVLAHELTHIQNRDVRLMVVAGVFVGVIAVIAEFGFRGVLRGNWSRTDRFRRSGGGNAAMLIILAMAVVGLAYGVALLTRFALSRRREFVADAGAAELTRNPDAMVRALRKVAGRSTIAGAPSFVRDMLLDNSARGLAGLFSTHPPIEARITALQRYAGAQVQPNIA